VLQTLVFGCWQLLNLAVLGAVSAVFHCLALLFAAAFVFYPEAGISQHCRFCWSSLLLLDIVAHWVAVPPLEAVHAHRIASTSNFSPVGTWQFAYLG
jgi:hypothetical protein